MKKIIIIISLIFLASNVYAEECRKQIKQSSFVYSDGKKTKDKLKNIAGRVLNK